ncbi:unnamed protein product [Effrenium voratum]|nr:unnamed protein product [Effrenium voratum]
MAGVGSRIPPPWAEVALTIYELHGTSALNLLTRAADMGGAYHVGVEVYWLEWSFGWCEEGSGVYMVFPGTSSLGSLRERVPLGRTPLTPEEVFRVLDLMRHDLPGSNYDLLRCNCAHFSVNFVKKLRVSEAPAWVNSLANVGEHLVAQLGMAGAQAAADAATPAERDRVAPKYQHFGDDDELEDLAGDGDDGAMRELAWRNAQNFVLEKAREAEQDAKTLDLAMELKWSPVPVHVVHDDLMRPKTSGCGKCWQRTVDPLARARGIPQIIADLEVVTSPDQALFGSRVETSAGPAGGKVLHSQGRAPKPAFQPPTRKPVAEIPVLRIGQELQQWQQQQRQLWHAQQQQMPQWKWQVQQLQVKAPAKAQPALDEAGQSLLKLQKIQQLDKLRRAASAPRS